MNHDYIFHKTLGDSKLTKRLCRQLNIPIPSEPQSKHSDMFIRARANFDHTNQEVSIRKLHKASQTLEDKIAVLDFCCYTAMPVRFNNKVVEEAIGLATTFREFRRIFYFTHVMNCNPGLHDKVNQWLIANGTFDDWLGFYNTSDEDTGVCEREYAYDQIIKLLKKEIPPSESTWILPGGQPYEEFIISP